MSTTLTIAILRKEQKKIEDLLVELEAKKKTVDAKYASVMEEENKVYDELRKCRDVQLYNKLQIQLNAVFKTQERSGSQETGDGQKNTWISGRTGKS